MAEYERIMTALRNAHEAGDTEAASRLARMAQAARAPEQTSTMSDVGQSLLSGALRGVGGILDLPSNAIDLAGRGAVSAAEMGAGLFGYENPEAFQSARDVWSSGRAPSASAGISSATGGFSERQPETTAGEYARTVGEFLPGTLMGGGASIPNLARYGLAPAIASEAAGQATEGMSVGGVSVEPIARMGAALVAPGVVGRVASPFGGADPAHISAAQRLRREGVDVRAGEHTGSSTLRALEGSVEPTARQSEQVTAAAMRSLGSTSPRATTTALVSVRDRIVGEMDDAIRGIDVPATPAMAQRALDIGEDYMSNAPASAIVGRVREVTQEIMDVATSPTASSIPATQLRRWRSAIGRLTQSSDRETRTAAHAIRELIDGATDSALIAAGRGNDIARLSEARRQYRNYLGVQDAATRAGAELGVVSAVGLNQSVIRTQGRSAYATGRGTDLSDLSRASAAVLRPEPTVAAAGVRNIPQLTQAGLLGAGGSLGYGLAGTPGAIAGTVGGAAIQPFARSLFGSRLGQAYLRNQAVGPAVGLLSPERLGALSTMTPR